MVAFLFDLEGTLVFARHVHISATRYALSKRKFPFKGFKSYPGVDFPTLIRKNYPQLQDKDLEEIIADEIEYFAKNVSKVILFKDTIPTLKKIYKKVPISLVTNEYEQEVNAILTTFKLSKFFKKVYYYKKRSPKNFQTLSDFSKRAPCPISEIRIVGDTNSDVFFAKKYGLECYVVERFKGNKIVEYEKAHFIKTLLDLRDIPSSNFEGGINV